MKLPDDSGSHLTKGMDSSTIPKDQRSSQSVVVNHTERRKSTRTPIRRLGYINLEPYDNGGVITDISRDGLRFHMVKPVEHGGVVRLSIVLGSTNHLDALGELVWLDRTRKMGGVRFTVLPEGAIDHIHEWAKGASGVDSRKSKSSRPTDKTENQTIPRQPFSSQSKPEVAMTTTDAASAPVAPTQLPVQPLPSPVAPAPAAASPAASEPTAGSVWAPPTATHIPVPPQTAPTQSATPQAQPQTQAGPQIRTRSPWIPPSARFPIPAATSKLGPQPQGSPDPRAVPPRPWMRPDESQQPNDMPWIMHFDPDPPAREGSFLRGLLGGFLLCALLGSGAWFVLRHHLLPNSLDQLSNPQMSNPVASSPIPLRADAQPTELPSDLSTASSVPPDTEQSAPSTQTSSPSINPALRSNPALQSRSEATSADPFAPKAAPAPQTSVAPLNPTPQATIAPSAPTTPNAQKALPPPAVQSAPTTNPFQAPLASSDAGESQLMLARQYLDGRVQPRNPTVASQLLWSAVEKGNSAAEMDLADLYLHGDGVPRNCDQARVLLSVASEKGNPEAMQKLRELNRTGCR